MKLNDRSENNLRGVHPDLVKVIRRAAELYDGPGYFVAIEGLRTLARQKELVKQGASKTMNSRHLTGHAVDLAPWVDTNGDGKFELSWQGGHFKPIEKAMKAAANELGIPLEWGGDWRGSWDKPHWQLPWKNYGSTNKTKVAELGAPIEEETENSARLKKTAAIAAGTSMGSMDGLDKAVGLITSQQDSLSNGNIASMIIAAVLVGIGIYLLWKVWR